MPNHMVTTLETSDLWSNQASPYLDTLKLSQITRFTVISSTFEQSAACQPIRAHNLLKDPKPAGVNFLKHFDKSPGVFRTRINTGMLPLT